MSETTQSNLEILDLNDTGFSLDGDDNSTTATSQFVEHGKLPKGDKKVRREIDKMVESSSKKKDPEEVKKHQELVIMLSRYGQSRRFSEFLKSMNFTLTVTQLKKMDLDELEELHTRVKTAIDNKNTSNFWEEMVFSMVQTGEIVCVKTSLGQKVKIQGITEMLRSDETFLDLIEQIELENQNIAYTSPYVRLIYSVVSSAMKCHGINSMLEKRMKMLEKEVKEEQKEVKKEVEKEVEKEVKEEVKEEIKEEVEKEIAGKEVKKSLLVFDDDDDE